MIIRSIGVFIVLTTVATAYPEFQKFSQTHSGRTVNCGMCHTSPEGPDGLSFGQIGKLDSLQMEQLNEARRALLPGTELTNPILNPFGNKILKVMGVRLLLEARKDPAILYYYLKDAGDLDGDGVIDAQEILDGTDATNRYHGDPLTLFYTNIRLYYFEIVMILLATVAGMFGLSNFLLGFARLEK